MTRFFYNYEFEEKKQFDRNHDSKFLKRKNSAIEITKNIINFCTLKTNEEPLLTGMSGTTKMK
jgi:hypothetical protein